MNILAFFAHPEDAACLCAGTLMKYRARGDEIYIALASGTRPPVGAQQIGAHVRLSECAGDCVEDNMDARADALTAIRWANADVILTHAPWDADGEHAVAGKLMNDSLLIVGGKLHPAHLPPIDKLPHLFYTDTLGGNRLTSRYCLDRLRSGDQSFYLTAGTFSNDPCQPEAYVQIDEFMQTKLELLRAEPELRALCQAHDRILGAQTGCSFAEGFSAHRNIGHLADLRLLP